MKKILLLLFLISTSYNTTEKNYISAKKIIAFLEKNTHEEIKRNFDLKTNKLTHKKKLIIETKSSHNSDFFLCGEKLKTLLNRIRSKKYTHIIQTALEFNCKKKIIFETKELWNQRSKKNQNKHTLIPLKTMDEYHIFHYEVFLNALNNAIQEDNEEIKTPLFIAEIKINNTPYHEINNTDFKNLIYISEETIKKFPLLFEKNITKTESIIKQEIIKIPEKNLLKTKKLILCLEELKSKIEEKINNAIQGKGKIHITISNCFTKGNYCYHENKLQTYLTALGNNEEYEIEIPGSFLWTDFAKENFRYDLPEILNHLLLALIEDFLIYQTKKGIVEKKEIISIDDLLSGENGIEYFFQKKENTASRKVNREELKKIIRKSINDNATENDLDDFINPTENDIILFTESIKKIL
jgi:hypothetical protein